MGGAGEVVETDESLFHGKRIYSRSRLLQGGNPGGAGGAAPVPVRGGGGGSASAGGVPRRNHGRRIAGS